MSELFSIEGKVALVTGGAQGMGRMIAEGLIKAGAKGYITSRKADICEQSAKELSAFGQCVAIPAGLDTPEAVVALADQEAGGQAGYPDQQRRAHLGCPPGFLSRQGLGVGDGGQRPGALYPGA